MRPSRTRPAASSRSRAFCHRLAACPEIGERGERVASHLADDTQHLDPLGAELGMEAFADEACNRRRDPAGADREDKVASTDDGRRGPVAVGDIVDYIDEYSSRSGLPGDRGARGGVVGRGDG